MRKDKLLMISILPLAILFIVFLNWYYPFSFISVDKSINQEVSAQKVDSFKHGFDEAQTIIDNSENEAQYSAFNTVLPTLNGGWKLINENNMTRSDLNKITPF